MASGSVFFCGLHHLETLPVMGGNSEALFVENGCLAVHAAIPRWESPMVVVHSGGQVIPSGGCETTNCGPIDLDSSAASTPAVSVMSPEERFLGYLVDRWELPTESPGVMQAGRTTAEFKRIHRFAWFWMISFVEPDTGELQRTGRGHRLLLHETVPGWSHLQEMPRLNLRERMQRPGVLSSTRMFFDAGFPERRGHFWGSAGLATQTRRSVDSRRDELILFREMCANSIWSI